MGALPEWWVGELGTKTVAAHQFQGSTGHSRGHSGWKSTTKGYSWSKNQTAQVQFSLLPLTMWPWTRFLISFSSIKQWQRYHLPQKLLWRLYEQMRAACLAQRLPSAMLSNHHCYPHYRYCCTTEPPPRNVHCQGHMRCISGSCYHATCLPSMCPEDSAGHSQLSCPSHAHLLQLRQWGRGGLFASPRILPMPPPKVPKASFWDN